MEKLVFKNLTFAYPCDEKNAIEDISFSVAQGEFILICGKSGCGKTTLLRHTRSPLFPVGKRTGEVLFDGVPLSFLSDAEQSSKIGFVGQSPENQIVTDKVWHELAFALEGLGADTQEIRRAVAEVSAFFGIDDWFHKSTSELSGGQKQILTLASVLTLHPEMIILDEPTSQLDPIAAAEFISLLGKINRDLGITVILSEHRLDEAFPFATRVVVMEDGKILCDGNPKDVGISLRNEKSSMFCSMPAAVQIWSGIDSSLPCPVTVREGRDYLFSLAKSTAPKPLKEKEKPQRGDVVLSAKSIYYRYEKSAPDVLRDLSISLRAGELYALLGGNGAGKSTALRVLCDLHRAYSGKVERKGKIALLMQDARSMLVKKTVREDLCDVLESRHVAKDEADVRIESISALCTIEDLLDRHPYDLSGGEQQKCALAKILLTSPDILLLDEPTKGFDAEFKEHFAAILKRLNASGVAVLMVSHDIAFAAEYADRCGMLFDGCIVAEDEPRAFFSGNKFYTTPSNRMARELIPLAVTPDEVIECFGGKVQKKPKAEEKTTQKKPNGEKDNQKKRERVPLWRKITAPLSLVLAIATVIYTLTQFDLVTMISSKGVTQKGVVGLVIYGLLAVSLLLFFISAKSHGKPTADIIKKSPASARTRLAAAVLLILAPITVIAGVLFLDDGYYRAVALAVLLECMLPFFILFEGRKPSARSLVIIAVMCAICIAGRSAFFMIPQFKPVIALTVISGVALGAESGFLVGAVTMLVSNMMFSQGPWTPWQMLAMGLVGFFSGVLARAGLLSHKKGELAVFGALCTVALYGPLMNFSSALLGGASINARVLFSYMLSGIPMDVVHAVSSAIFLLLIAEPMLEKLDRVKNKIGE